MRLERKDLAIIQCPDFDNCISHLTPREHRCVTGSLSSCAFIRISTATILPNDEADGLQSYRSEDNLGNDRFSRIEASMAITRRNMLPVLVIVIGLEPIMISVILLVARVPDQKPEDTASPSALPDIEAHMQGSEKMTDHR
ncbi:hypothetical protein G7Y89_g5202 [Cudoniella acicularis]|uniref:Uncharacterized protein n=1 Tax=Cudoniella acicularis TaxID=354080 RepID=A0A8H4RMY2_9HELO|nr:hypothetical protein G7Y89_g5202 [Cudoniella acicularis]